MSTVRSLVVRYHEYGEPLDVLVAEQALVAAPPPGRVRVNVVASGLNPADWELCRGVFMPGALPRGIGYDTAGVVDAVGEGVADVAPGDVVVGAADLAQPSAGAADVAILESWVPVPEGVDPVRAATLPMVVRTAVWTLDRMGVGPRTRLLVHGAGAMVGFAAVQIASELGASVVATAGPTYASDLEGFGAAVTSYRYGATQRVRELAGGHVDLVLDAAPPRPGTVETLLDAVREPRDLVTISNHDEARRLGARVNLDLLAAGEQLVDPLPEYLARVAAGTFRLPVARALPLGRWREAVELSVSGAPRGKVVLLPGRDA